MKTGTVLGLAAALASAAARAAPPADVTLKSATDERIFRLADARGKYVVLNFLLKTECPFCLRHTRAYVAGADTLPNTLILFIKPDSDEDIRKWASNLTAAELKQFPIYRDPEAKLAEQFGIPSGYTFHGHVVRYPALIVLGPDGSEIFRHVGRNNADRFSFEQLAEKLRELSRPKE